MIRVQFSGPYIDLHYKSKPTRMLGQGLRYLNVNTNRWAWDINNPSDGYIASLDSLLNSNLDIAGADEAKKIRAKIEFLKWVMTDIITRSLITKADVKFEPLDYYYAGCLVDPDDLLSIINHEYKSKPAVDWSRFT